MTKKPKIDRFGSFEACFEAFLAETVELRYLVANYTVTDGFGERCYLSLLIVYVV